MNDDRLAVFGEPHVALDRVNADRECVGKRDERVLGTELRATAVRDGDRRTRRRAAPPGRDLFPAGRTEAIYYSCMSLPSSLGSLREAVKAGRVPHRSVKDELRSNLVAALRAGRPLFPGIIGYDDTVVPQVVNAILSRHNFILLGLRGQAKTRLLRALVSLLDPEIPVVPGCEIHDDPLRPLCAACRARVVSEGDDLPVAWRSRDDRYVEKLATPDVTIADMIGDVDPIKAARSAASWATK